VSSPPPRGRTRSYAASGVDLGRRDRALHGLLSSAAYRAPGAHGRPVAAPGHFAGLVRIGSETIALTTDTVGTKVLLAERLGRWSEVGEDLVAINVNDLAAVGARPSALVDTILCGEPDEGVFRAIGRGIARGLAAARCSLVGGETALVREIVPGIDLGATALGFFPGGRRPILGRNLRPGDRLLGLRSAGVHANGFTLVRRLLAESRVALGRPRPGGRRPVGVELLTPTVTYSEAVDRVADLAGVVGLAHLSGGGVTNLLRLSSSVGFELDGWPSSPPIFSWLQELGGIPDREMFRTFNMGIGFVLAVRPARVPEVRRRLSAALPGSVVEVGTVVPGPGVTVPSQGLSYTGYA
jgi:phosphoribosylformylglycinamidine cyclo-ligase